MQRELSRVGERLRRGQLPDLPLDPAFQYDAAGRKQPRRLDFLTFVRAAPQLAERVRKVPAHAIDDSVEDGAMVTCPCGGKPVVPDTLIRCPGDCGRWYVWWRSRWVYVAYEGEIPA